MAGESSREMNLLQVMRRRRNNLLNPRCVCVIEGDGARYDLLTKCEKGVTIKVTRVKTCPVHNRGKTKGYDLVNLKEVNWLWPYEMEDSTAKFPDGAPPQMAQTK